VAAEEDFDVIVIGTGAGGGTLAHRLAPSGKRILIL
jgi:choline dehydrogenase-like flavoprotein